MRFLNSIQKGSLGVAVDVGAAIGSYTWILSRLAEQVYAFEPGIAHSRYLSRLVLGTNISVIPAALGSACGRATLYTPGGDADALHSATVSKSNPAMRRNGTWVTEVAQVTLDSFFAGRLAADRTVDVMKVDAEGYELEVLRGSFETLSRHHPLIVCEIEARHNPAYPEVFDFLRRLGYQCYIIRRGKFEAFLGERLEDIQLDDDLRMRLAGNYDPDLNEYVNNFLFHHPNSRVRVSE